MKKLLFIFLIASLLILLFVPSVWNWFAGFWPGANEGTSQLLVKSIAGDYTVYVDNKKVGEVTNDDSKLFPKLSAGEKTIKLVRNSKTSDLYFTLEKKLNFLSASQVEITWSAGPTLESSEGVIKSFDQISRNNGAELNIVTYPTSATVTMNDSPIEKNSIITTTDTLKLKVSDDDKTYDPKDLEIRLVDGTTKTVPNNIRLNLEFYLYKRPIE